MLEFAQIMINYLLLGLGAWALIDCALRPAAAFPAVDRQTKVAWLTFLAIGLVVMFIFGGISLLGMAAVVLTVYYFVDVRTKVVQITRR